eukprot:6136542-Pleurochrysis_carterae.AAC.2
MDCRVGRSDVTSAKETVACRALWWVRALNSDFLLRRGSAAQEERMGRQGWRERAGLGSRDRIGLGKWRKCREWQRYIFMFCVSPRGFPLQAKPHAPLDHDPPNTCDRQGDPTAEGHRSTELDD